MPHAELKYSAGLEIDAEAVLAGIEEILQRHDPDSGACKGRAYPASISHHEHLIAEISLLPKSHRDAAFMAALQQDLRAYLLKALPRPCYMSLELRFSGATYSTELLS